MPKLLEDKNGYYYVTSWEHVLTYRLVVTKKEVRSFKGGGYLPIVALSYKIEDMKRSGELPESFHILGSEERVERDRVIETVWWARKGQYQYIGKEIL